MTTLASDDLPPPPTAKPPGRGRQRRPTSENMLDKDNLLSGCDEFGTRIRIFTATSTGEREIKAHLGKFVYTGTAIPADGEVPSDVTQTEEVVEEPGVKGRLSSGLVRHGYGEIKYTSGSVFKGQWEHNKRSGKGTFYYPCGDVYEGEWKAGKYHGFGRYTSGDSDGRALEYEGEWKGDKMDGYGKYKYKDSGDVFEGNFINGFREGFGKYTTKAGGVWMGEYDGGELRSKTKIDKASFALGTDEWGKRIQFFTASLTGERALQAGLGKFIYTGQTIASSEELLLTDTQLEYEHAHEAVGEAGRLESGRVRHGHGEIRYDSGSVYVGHWEHDKRTGKGKFIFACGDVYEGEWLNNKYHGHGKYTSADSDEYEGQWQNDTMEGHGLYHYRVSGDVYEGDWTGGVSHGFGKYTKASTGEVFMGHYANGELTSKSKIDQGSMLKGTDEWGKRIQFFTASLQDEDDKASFALGTDEWGKRIQFFTASLTGERAIRAGLGKFMYTGETIDPSLEERPPTAIVSVVEAPGEYGRLSSGLTRHGYGEIKYTSGSVFKGQWEHDKRVGKGTFAFACGDVYEGEWRAGMYHGRGKYTSADSDEYEGEWRFDIQHGHGRYHYHETGDIYEGGFVNGIREGVGKYTTAATGETVEVSAAAGKLVDCASA
eukprot:CAMPEP_0174758588 /NCGR_PEP_ID=MMETSP1094-20130205/107838_1 /TAXON_ID=156173 /ORGANISM="Chrysochromulina brevifilum, Strain UTEX LB 985" /LENGTH=657 /DNA_ID=CAMNT_0015964515 /DNA_START=16 /DNA_END=1990 /DNA_ORIENTATION=-